MGKNNIYFGNDIANGTGMLVITAKRLPLNSRGSVRPTDEYSSKFDPEGVAQRIKAGRSRNDPFLWIIIEVFILHSK